MTQPASLTPPNILSIQSWVSYGHVGNAAAVFPLQRLGFEVWAINTVQFSNHTGYGAWTGQVFAPEVVAELIDGIEARGVLPSCGAVLSGYLGSGGTVAAVAEAVKRVRAANPQALYCCDPVMGDYGRGVFVRPELPELIAAQAVAQADILTPNQFELELLSGQTVQTLPQALSAAHELRDRMRRGGPRVVVVTSLVRVDALPDSIETLAVTEGGAWLCRTPLLPLESAAQRHRRRHRRAVFRPVPQDRECGAGAEPEHERSVCPLGDHPRRWQPRDSVGCRAG